MVLVQTLTIYIFDLSVIIHKCVINQYGVKVRFLFVYMYCDGVSVFWCTEEY